MSSKTTIHMTWTITAFCGTTEKNCIGILSFSEDSQPKQQTIYYVTIFFPVHISVGYFWFRAGIKNDVKNVFSLTKNTI